MYKYHMYMYKYMYIHTLAMLLSLVICMLSNVSKPDSINLPCGDSIYHTFMAILGSVLLDLPHYHIVMINHN